MPTSTTAEPAVVERPAMTPTRLPLAELRQAMKHLHGLLMEDAEFTFRRLAAVHDLWAEIEAACERMDDGTYGMCRRCWQAIPLQRLSLMPYARYCASCQFADAPVVAD